MRICHTYTINHICFGLIGAAQQDSVQSVRDPYTTLQHLSVHTGMCCCRPVHPGAEWRYPRGEEVKLWWASLYENMHLSYYLTHRLYSEFTATYKIWYSWIQHLSFIKMCFLWGKLIVKLTPALLKCITLDGQEFSIFLLLIMLMGYISYS